MEPFVHSTTVSFFSYSLPDVRMIRRCFVFVCTAPCSGGCNSENGGGTCIGPETCVCNDEWTGSNCETRTYVHPWHLVYHNNYTELSVKYPQAICI